MIGSPTALAEVEVEKDLKSTLQRNKSEAKTNGLYVPSGALWGGEDITKMAERGMLQVI